MCPTAAADDLFGNELVHIFIGYEVLCRILHSVPNGRVVEPQEISVIDILSSVDPFLEEIRIHSSQITGSLPQHSTRSKRTFRI